MTVHSEPADRADVVVVGGGIFGVSLTLHLLQAGVRNVRLLERDTLFAGTSGAGGGFLAPWSVLNPMHGTESRALPIERYGLDFYAGLHAEGHDIDYHRNGVLWIAADEPTWAQTQGMAFTAADPDSADVAPADLPSRTGGIVGGEGVHGARYLPSGAQLHVPKVGGVLAERIRALGGVIEEHRPVTGVRVAGGRVTGVETPHGPVSAGTVVLAAGAWTAKLLADVGFFLPAVPQITSRIITEAIGIPATLPVLMLQGLLPDEPGGGTVLWVRSHHGGLLWGGMYLTEPRNLLVDAAVPDRLDELPLDGVLENQRAARGATFMPALTRPASFRIKHGAPCYTPDDLALVGPVPAADGLFVMGGDNELGVTHGPGFGRALAELIANGRSELVDLAAWRPDRFGDRYTTQAETLHGVLEQFGQVLVGAFDEQP